MQIWGDASQVQPESTVHAQSEQKLIVSATVLFNSSFSPASDIALPSVQEHPMFYVGVYALIGVLSVIGDTIANSILVFGAYRASRIFFEQMLTNVTRATMRWHDTTPTGKIYHFYHPFPFSIHISL
jgi:ABC-type multidrug transport system fused ATPase/permease subunit